MGLKSPKILIAIGLIGIFLIFFSSLFESKPQVSNEKSVSFSSDEYRLSLQDDIALAVKEITGSKNVTVVITLENSISYSYADTREESSSDSSDDAAKSSDTELKESYVTVKTSDGGEQALLITTEMPKVRGVAIVCDGGDNELLKEKIQNTVTAALNITKKRVNICGRN